MLIYIFRHSDAVNLDNEIGLDGDKYLSITGRSKANEVAKKLKILESEFDVILTSPLARAVQSAEITANVLGYKGEIKTAKALAGSNSFQKFIHLIIKHSDAESIAIFGHAPDVSLYTNKLLNRSTHDSFISFNKSSVCKIDFDLDKNESKLVWYFDAEEMHLYKG
jgi:phosphohistidine phosphatase